MTAVTNVLDTSADGETGALQEVEDKSHRLGYVQVEIGSGDTYVIEGQLDRTASFVILATFTANGLELFDLPRFWRARRTVDGGNDGNVWVEMVPV